MADSFRDIFLSRAVNGLQDYERFYHVKFYIRSKSRETETTEELMKAAGYRKKEKFRIHRQQFDDLARKVPLGYLEAIGADLDIIEWCVRLDRREFERMCQKPLYPRHAAVRLIPGIYKKVDIPEGTSEDEAIEYVRQFSVDNRLVCLINYPGFKTVYVETDGTVQSVYYPPEIRLTKQWLIPGSGGCCLGITRI